MNNLRINTLGKKLLLGIFSITILFSLIVTIMSYRVIGTEDIVQHIIRIILEIALMITLYKGKMWARWVFVVLFFIGGAFSFFNGFDYVAYTSLGTYMIVTGFIYMLFSVFLFISTDITEFLEHQSVS